MAEAVPLIEFAKEDTRRVRVRPTETEGVPGFAFFGGYIESGEKSSALQGTERYNTFAEIVANTAIVAAGVRYFLNLVAKAGWRAEPAVADTAARQTEADRLAELVEDMMEDMRRPWHRVVRRAAMYRFYGFSIQEWTAKRRADGAIGYLDIMARPQHTIEQWDVEPDGNVIGVIQRSPVTGESIYLNRQKLIYLVEDSISDSPEGLGLLRHLVDLNTRLKLYEKLESYSFETDLRGIPVIKGPWAAIEDEVRADKLSREDADKMVDPMKKFIERHIKSPTRGLLLDSEPYRAEDEAASPSGVPQWSFEIVNGGDQGQVPVAAAVERLNREAARIIGVEGLLLGGGQVGSLALSQDKSQNFGLIIDSTLAELREQMEHDFLSPLWLLNGWDPELMPGFKTDQVQYRDIEQITRALVDLANAGGVVPSDWEGINVVLELLGLPAVDLEAIREDLSLRTPPATPDPTSLDDPEDDPGAPIPDPPTPPEGE